MNHPTEPSPVAQEADAAPARGIERRARALLGLLALLLLSAAGYLMHARGVFEPTQRLILVTDDAEGVTVGMDLTFSGFAIGRVRRIGLADDGSVRIEIDVPRRDARWLREVSVFTLERGLVGGTRLRAYTGVMDSPPLPDGAVRPVLRGDALADLPRVVNTARELVEQLKAMTAPQAPVNASLRELRELLARANQPGGALQAMLGERDRQRVTALLDDSRRVLAGVQGVLERVEAGVRRADERLLAPEGVAGDAQAALREARALLADLRGSLKRIDGVLDEAHGVARNVRAATVDLDALRAEVEVTLKRVDALMLDLQRRWPFARETEVRLP
ncbi:virulence factor Mce family protein [Tepidimonas alkaliphilus]|uniref:Virulence factor Mce family protein n=1 Tax=Tepidimonas alkaliphilus TaxID=2588942 RepID=A0A554WA32_9BURK|nr:MlaD family protein [Tepidimonas alkaliphilus]TSE20435.1 virulence factor Mce family protein [Tepidimonas alkaliphilus]